MANAPAFRYPSPDETLLRDLVTAYEHITGDPVRRQAKRNLIAACYRVHGDGFLPLVARRFASTGTVINLLGEIRLLEPEEPPAFDVEEEAEPPEPETLRPHDASLNPVSSPAESEALDPDPEPRDRHGPSTSDAGTLFSDDELGVRYDSPTARALGR